MKLLLLHPLPLDGSIFSDELRRPGAEVVAPTLYGAGDTIESWARAALDHAGAGPLVVVGNSIGGSCALEVARLAPDKVAALVLVGAKAGHRPEPELRDAALELLATEGLPAAWDRYWRPLFGPAAPPAVVDRAWRCASALGADAIANGVRAFHGRPDRERFLVGWPGPVHLVWGEHDLDPAANQALAGRLRNGRFAVVESVGHYVPLEAPAVLTAVVAAAVAGAG